MASHHNTQGRDRGALNDISKGNHHSYILALHWISVQKYGRIFTTAEGMNIAPAGEWAHSGITVL
jgi:hypothetical protein